MMNKDPWSARKNLYRSPVPKTAETPHRKWSILRILWSALKKTCTTIGAMVLISGVLIYMAVAPALKNIEQPPSLPDQMVLYLELNGDIGEVSREINFADPFAAGAVTLKDFVDALTHAKTDDRVKGVYAKMNAGGYSVAHIQEMREAIKDFRSSGKFAYIYASSFDYGLGAYYLASAFDEIWMQPMGVVIMTGISAEIPFVRGVLDKVGVEPQFFQRKEYKSAYESFTNDQISEANRESTTALISDIADVLKAGIAADRDLPLDSIKGLVDHGIFIADEALKAGLINTIDYSDRLVDKVNTDITGDVLGTGLTYINFDTYVQQVLHKSNSLTSELLQMTEEEKPKSKPRIALIYAVGAIMDSDGREVSSAPAGLMQEGVAAADKISAALLDAADDADIDEVVLRVDSPGGSPVASETILRAVEKVQEKGKKVVVSMGTVAASGGYWISAYADQIFVLPTTITGSIGVLGGKVSIAELWKTLGVNWARIGWGENSAIWSINSAFSESESERINAMLDNIYDGFLARVSKGRKMDVDQVDAIAHGRVWSGAKAVEIGLADQLGGLNAALDYASVAAGAKNRFGVDVVIMPKPLSPIEQFVELLNGQVKAGKIMGIQAALLQAVQPKLSEFMIMQNPRNHGVYNPIEVR